MNEEKWQLVRPSGPPFAAATPSEKRQAALDFLQGHLRDLEREAELTAQ